MKIKFENGSEIITLSTKSKPKRGFVKIRLICKERRDAVDSKIIYESDDWMVNRDKHGRILVSYFEDNHFKDELILDDEIISEIVKTHEYYQNGKDNEF